MEFHILKVKILSTDLMFPIAKSKTSTAISRSQGHSVICLNTHMIRLLYLIDVASVQTKTLTFRYLHFTIQSTEECARHQALGISAKLQI